MNILLEKLRKKYMNTKFAFKENDYFKIVLFNNDDLKEDEEFLEFVYKLVEEYLDEEDQMKFCVVFDYLDELDLHESEIQNECEEEFCDKIYLKTETNEVYFGKINMTMDFDLKSEYQMKKSYLEKRESPTNIANFIKTTFTDIFKIESKSYSISNTTEFDIRNLSGFHMNSNTIVKNYN